LKNISDAIVSILGLLILSPVLLLVGFIVFFNLSFLFVL
jgi:hypothetical protein